MYMYFLNTVRFKECWWPNSCWSIDFHISS